MNYEQKKRYDKINTEEIYLLDKLIEKDNMTFNISGSTANVYKVVIYEKYKNIDCNCPDMRSWAKKYKCVCKHCCFILFKVLKAFTISDANSFYNSLHFSNDEMKTMRNKFEQLIITGDIINEEYLEKYKNLNVENFKSIFEQKREIKEDDYCIICFDEYEKDSKNIECPTCHNIIHKQCMTKWLNMGKTSCVYCRSEIWKKFIENKSSSDYLNLL